MMVLVTLGCGMLVAWGYGLIEFAGTFPTAVQEPDRKTDAIVVLTGGSGRLEAGLSLLQNDSAETLFVSGVYQGIDVNNLIALVQEDRNNLSSRVEIGNATNTRGNASETAMWIKGRDIRSLRLVTAAYHMPRSLLEFTHAVSAASTVEIIPNPVFPEHVKTDWWLWPGTTILVVKEYNKYIMAWGRLFVERLADGTLLTLLGHGTGTAD